MAQKYDKNQPVIQKQPKFSVVIQTDTYQKLVNNTLGDPEKAKHFVASITSAVAVNPALQDCEAGSILAGALLGESLNLSPSPQLGHYYLVPFKTKTKLKDDNGNDIYTYKAQFVLGYKGYIQMALRSAQYKFLNVVAVKQGEFISWDPFREDLRCNWSTAENRDELETVGYAACYEYLNGFRKTLYWSKEKMLAHADKYSPAFSAAAYNKIQAGQVPDDDMWKYSSFWYKDFDAMGMKTMLRQLIGKWGVMSIEFRNSYDNDGKALRVTDTGEFLPDNGDDFDNTTPLIQPGSTINPEATSTAQAVNLDDL